MRRARTGPLDVQRLYVGDVRLQEGHLPRHQQAVEADLVALAVGGLCHGDAMMHSWLPWSTCEIELRAFRRTN